MKYTDKQQLINEEDKIICKYCTGTGIKESRLNTICAGCNGIGITDCE